MRDSVHDVIQSLLHSAFANSAVSKYNNNFLKKEERKPPPLLTPKNQPRVIVSVRHYTNKVMHIFELLQRQCDNPGNHSNDSLQLFSIIMLNNT